MTRRVWLVLAVVIALLAGAGVVKVVVGTAQPGRAALPASMASAGDSLTRAFDVDQGHLFRDAPAQSWSTGADPTIASHYDRLLAANPAIAGRAFNDARTGAKMAALDYQLRLAASQRADYVTVLMGANDVCAPTVAAMTPTAAFEAQFRQALKDFFAADSGARVLVASIPDVVQLWAGLRASAAAETIWAVAHICQSVLSVTATPADRDAVSAQVQADNGVLAAVCARYDHCRFDGNAVYRARFGPAEVSSLDYFHPSVTGQQMLAAVTWAAGFWPATR